MILDQQIRRAEEKLQSKFEKINTVAEKNLRKILSAMKRNKLSEHHFYWNTGYGYDDAGREVTENIFANVFGKEDAIVRTQICSGTHALNLMIMGLVRPYETVISITGKPYDTLEATFGIRPSKGIHMRTIGANYEQIELKEGNFDMETLMRRLSSSSPEYIYIQRTPGYSWRKHLTVPEINRAIREIKACSPKTVVLLDNCYGEFTEDDEPNADVLAGSLIKNPGGGIALAGGYIAGRADLVEQISERLTAPHIGKEIGLTYGQTRNILQGLFMAPTVVASAMKGALLVGEVFSEMGYRIAPNVEHSDGHIIQAIELGTEERLLKFCAAVQGAAPVNSFVTPLPAPMPGYDDDVIMAAGTFVQGSSIEMSADGPVRPPYNVYFQGGLNYEHIKIALYDILEAL